MIESVKSIKQEKNTLMKKLVPSINHSFISCNNGQVPSQMEKNEASAEISYGFHEDKQFSSSGRGLGFSIEDTTSPVQGKRDC